MMILQVSMQEMNPAQVNHLTRRFGKFFNEDDAMVQYPVSCDSHGLDIFTDEFELGTIHEGRVYAAWLVETHMDHDDFVPFTEDDGGDVLADWTPAFGWDFHPATD